MTEGLTTLEGVAMGKATGTSDAARWFDREGDAKYWRERFERAAEERDEAQLQLRELARQVHQWALSEYGASEALMTMYRRSGEMGERITRPRTFGCVYYARRSRDRVKIGWSSSFLTRMQTLYIQPDDVLAVEPGGIELEQARHRQFAAARVKSTELFELHPELEQHIQDVRLTIPDGDPWAYGLRLCVAT